MVLGYGCFDGPGDDSWRLDDLKNRTVQQHNETDYQVFKELIRCPILPVFKLYLHLKGFFFFAKHSFSPNVRTTKCLMRPTHSARPGNVLTLWFLTAQDRRPSFPSSTRRGSLWCAIFFKHKVHFPCMRRSWGKLFWGRHKLRNVL